MTRLEAISKIEKWFEVKPPARGAYAPEGTVHSPEESRPRVGTSSKPSVRTAGRTEIGPFGIFEMASNILSVHRHAKMLWGRICTPKMTSFTPMALLTREKQIQRLTAWTVFGLPLFETFVKRSEIIQALPDLVRAI